MARARKSIRKIQDTLARLLAPTLLGVIVLLVSTLTFIYSYRNDLIIFAAQNKQTSVVKTLITVGGTAYAATETFPEPALIEYLHALLVPGADKEESPELVETLFTAGATVTERNAAGWTPLMLAAGAGQLPIVEFLVRKGSDIDARGTGGEQTEGMTALMAAAMNGRDKVAKFLIEHGANIHLRSRSGFNALLLAATCGHMDCVELLLNKGASVLLSTIEVAETNGHPEIAERLRKARTQPRSDLLSRRPAHFPEE